MANIAKAEKFTKLEKSWIMYDWANSVYATNIMAAIFPIYFTSVCGQDNVGLQWWGLGTSIATLIAAVLSPLLGAMGDYKGVKKKLFTAFMLIGVVFTLVMAIFDNWQMLLVGYMLSYIGFAGSCMFYDSFLTDVTTSDRVDRVSSWGYAAGYIGGSTIPFVISIGILFLMGMSNPAAVKLTVVLTSVWWLLFSIPFLKNVHQKHDLGPRPKGVAKAIFGRIGSTVKEMSKRRGLILYIIAYFFYIDGVGTVIHMASTYGATLGLDATGMILALLVTQLVAVPSSILFGRLAQKVGGIKMIGFGIGMYFLICIVGFWMGFTIENAADPSAAARAQTIFWVVAVMVGTVQGGIQALSRSHFSKMVPPNKSNEYFGIFDIFGKFATVFGPLLMAGITMLTGRSSFGILSLILLFGIGGTLLFIGRKDFQKAADDAQLEATGKAR